MGCDPLMDDCFTADAYAKLYNLQFNYFCVDLGQQVVHRQISSAQDR